MVVACLALLRLRDHRLQASVIHVEWSHRLLLRVGWQSLELFPELGIVALQLLLHPPLLCCELILGHPGETRVCHMILTKVQAVHSIAESLSPLRNGPACAGAVAHQVLILHPKAFIESNVFDPPLRYWLHCIRHAQSLQA